MVLSVSFCRHTINYLYCRWMNYWRRHHTIVQLPKLSVTRGPVEVTVCFAWRFLDRILPRMNLVVVNACFCRVDLLVGNDVTGYFQPAAVGHFVKMQLGQKMKMESPNFALCYMPLHHLPIYNVINFLLFCEIAQKQDYLVISISPSLTELYMNHKCDTL